LSPSLSLSYRVAFTLIELLVVIAIVGILSGLIVVSMSGVTQKATIAKAQVFSNSLRNSLMLNLVSEWKLDQIVGSIAPYTVSDSWSGGNTGTLMNGASNACSLASPFSCPQLVTSGCPSGNCLSFDGADDYVAINNISISNNAPITVSFWAKTVSNTTLDDVLIIYGRDGTTSECLGLYYRVADNYVRVTTWGSDYATGFVKDFNVWHYWAITYNLTSVLIYRDGVVDPIGVQNKTISFTLNRLLIGTALYTNNYFNGYIDDVRLYNVSIPTSQIKEQYYVGLNKLFANGGITNEEYSQRLNGLASK
jgi:prepilin-type N-terminal cleavage/methylation domain-containing protein